MQVTFETKIRDQACYPLLERYAALYGTIERALFRDLYVRGLSINDLKQQYQPRFGITARQFNSIRVFLEGKVKAVREGLSRRLAVAREKIKSTEQAITELTKKVVRLCAKFPKTKTENETDSSGPTKANRLYFKLHHKKRRLHLLTTKLAKLETEATRPVPRLTFGTNKLFRAQFHLKENGYANHAEWKADWEAARAGQFVCVGSKDETGGNQSATYFPTSHTLRLRLPPAVARENGDKYLFIKDMAFPYGQEVLEAARSGESKQALTFRFMRRRDKSRSGELLPTYSWYVQVTTERKAAPKTTERRLGAIGLDLNPTVIATTTLDRYGNPIARRHLPLRLHKRSSKQATASIADGVGVVVGDAHRRGVPVVIERLDFTHKKNELREKSNRYAHMLSSFAYKKFYELIHARASRCGVEVIEVNPAFTSVIGTVKFKSGYGLSTHQAAALAIGRRANGFGETLRSRAKPLDKVKVASNPTNNALSLPVRNRAKHVWSDWRKVAQRLRPLRLTYLRGRGRPSSEDTSGGSLARNGLVELSFPTAKPQQVYALWL
jgi:IS605 OrfB family transposase